MGAEPWRRGGGSAGWSLPSWEGLAAAANSHLVRRLRLARPGPWGGLLLLLHGCHRPRPVLALTSSRALQSRGPSLGRDRMSQAPDALRIGGRQSGSDGVGGGERWGGEEERHQASSPSQDPSFGHRRPSNSPLPPPPTTTPPPQSVDSLGERTPPTDKLAERRAAGERHLTVLERCLAVPEEPGSPSTAVCAPRQPPGAPRAKLSAPGGAAGSRAPASLEQLQSGREHCAWRELPTRAAEAARLRGSPHPLPPPAGSC